MASSTLKRHVGLKTIPLFLVLDQMMQRPRLVRFIFSYPTMDINDKDSTSSCLQFNLVKHLRYWHPSNRFHIHPMHLTLIRCIATALTVGNTISIYYCFLCES